MSLLKSNKGFSLIELMVVVAIIGILASIAVPNFQRFQRSTRQKEAQTMMSGIWKAEKAFFQQYNQYTSDLASAGFRPEGTLYYTAGFNAADALSAPRNWFSATALSNAMYHTGLLCADTNNFDCNDPNFSGNMTNTATPTGTGDGSAFTVGAAGDIGGSNLDVWTLDDGKNFSNIQDGL